MMKWLIVLVAACNTADGTRAPCAEGGALTACPEAERTPQAACWYLVDCGAIVLKASDPNRFDWNNCVGFIESRTADRARLVIDCIAASSCDQLKVDGSPDNPDTNHMSCIVLGIP